MRRSAVLDLRTVVRRRFATMRARVPNGLDAVLDRALRARNVGVDDVWPYFDPLCQPVVRLPVWAAELCSNEAVTFGPIVLTKAIDAAMFGYLYARLADDLLDRPDPSRDLVLLAQWMFLQHHSSLVRIVGRSPAYWKLHREAWSVHAHASQLELDLRRHPRCIDMALLGRLTDRAAPLVLPGTALIHSCGLGHHHSRLADLARCMASAAQLVDDLVDAETDLSEGNMTYVVTRFGGLMGVDALRRRLLTEAGFATVLGMARRYLMTAEAMARGFGLAIAVQDIEDARRTVDEIEQVYASKLLAAMVGRAPE